MGKNETAAAIGSIKMEDVEEGEISDTASVEEISEDDFNKQEVVVVKETPSSTANNNSKQKVWDAVQNKPLNELFVEVEVDDSSNKSSVSSVTSSKEDKRTVVTGDSGDDMDVVKFIDIEKEEGELEEGEIDLDSEVKSEGGMVSVDTDKRVKSIREDLESVSVIKDDKSFEAVCLKLQNALESLKALVRVDENGFPSKDGLVRLLFTAIGAVNSVFSSMNQKLKEQNKGVFMRFLSLVNSHDSSFFSPEHTKEVELLLSSLDSHDILSSSSTAEERETRVSGKVNEKDNGSLSKTASYDWTTMNRFASAADSAVYNKPNFSVEPPKPGVPSFKSRGALLPLLDLKKFHDEDSLPSPTRDTTPSLPFQRVSPIGDGMISSGLPVPKVASITEEPRMHPYETDALKAVSSYQQKFNLKSFFSNELPSPTPSEESGNGDGDTAGEVSSSSTVNYRTVNPPVSDKKNASPSPPPPPPPPPPHLDSSCIRVVMPARNSAPVSSGTSLTVKASAKSRDPRLRYVNTDNSALDQNQRTLLMVNNPPRAEPSGAIAGSRKQKIEEDALDGMSLKRQRNSFDNFGVRDARSMTGTGGWLEDTDMAEPHTVNKNQRAENAELGQRINNGAVCPSTGTSMSNVSYSGNVQVPVMGISTIAGSEQVPVTSTTTASLPDLLKDITVNPTMLINILKMGQQQRLALDGQQKLADPAKSTSHPPIPSQIATTDESGKIRMKPRDPRRVLHNNALQRAGSLGPEQFKTTSTLTSTIQGPKDNQNMQKQEGLAELKPVVPPDISSPFTKSLKNIADIVSVSHTSTTQPFGSQNVASQPNTWEDVEHLFEGYDDQQKAAIQRERARRIEEQKKMFAARKLCLVLDLDHTLLNSAKFVEVDPVHDEILRKKEEQDREKPYRHLFRFPHMGMWTKLRPGIWNFLEKASKLYELHLYTMGNKVPKSKDLEGVLGMESGVVIIDDSLRVWPHNKLNLIVVERYIYFPCSRRQFGLPGPSLLEIDHDERPEDGTLACSLAVIERIHQNFFTHHSLDEADVRNILASEQRNILAGCRIVFSRVFPVGEVHPHLHPLWQTAEQFGAVCTNQIDDQVTHVVANSLGTDKVNWALSTGRFVVHPGWVEASALLYRRASEQDFAIKP
ncbi:RNA polymerase II C-TERMINAL DOMAIN PHOSPHATASE-LIKE 3 [Salix purpurea]|uniref:protein-serine/threonine phosphatase n=1 Tax=Salix purpurea TaxID=77065 RepID=A0A9Q0QEX3_SALPP|nr:RNA polymerase II C-TERMINAL DOMAIN PHOSPHATASE-LIKE 3 [Salix purpurea]